MVGVSSIFFSFNKPYALLKNVCASYAHHAIIKHGGHGYASQKLQPQAVDGLGGYPCGQAGSQGSQGKGHNVFQERP